MSRLSPDLAGDAVTDAAAITSAATAGGAVGLTGAAATDLDTFSATVVADLAELRTQLNALLAAVRAAGVIDT